MDRHTLGGCRRGPPLPPGGAAAPLPGQGFVFVGICFRGRAWFFLRAHVSPGCGLLPGACVCWSTWLLGAIAGHVRESVGDVCESVQSFGCDDLGEDCVEAFFVLVVVGADEFGEVFAV